MLLLPCGFVAFGLQNIKVKARKLEFHVKAVRTATVQFFLRRFRRLWWVCCAAMCAFAGERAAWSCSEEIPVKKSAFQMESSTGEFPQEQSTVNRSNTKIGI
jgi:hypothetical protein